MAEFEFPCSQCGQTIIIDEEGAGMEIQCPGCQAPLIVPEPAPTTSPKQLSLKQETIVSPAYTPGPPVRQESPREKGKGKEFVSTALKWTWRAVLVGIVAAIGFVVYSYVSRVQATSLAHDMITELGAQSMSDWSRTDMTGFRNSAADTAKKIAPLLPKTPDLFKEECVMLSKSGDAFRRTAKYDALTGIISQLPPGADLTPLLVIPASSEVIYKCARDKLAADAPEAWLIEKSCHEDEQVRKLVADALKLWLPIELPPQEAALAARLTEQTPVEEKQKLFDQLNSSVASIVEKRVTGTYYIHADVVYRDDKIGERSFSLQSKQPCLTVERRNQDWTFNFFGETWSGRLKDIAKVNFSLPIPSETFNNPYLANKTGALTVRLPDNALVLQIGPITSYEPPRGDEWGYVYPSQPGFTKFDYSLVKTGATRQ